jgi:hypothetical protein
MSVDAPSDGSMDRPHDVALEMGTATEPPAPDAADGGGGGSGGVGAGGADAGTGGAGGPDGGGGTPTDAPVCQVGMSPAVGGGSCRKSNGQACAGAADCASGFCADGVCCDSTCTGTCRACNVAGMLGTCSPVIGAPDPGRCSGADVCTPTGACLPKNGTPCTSTTPCASGLCRDGVCCDAECAGTCVACNVPGNVGSCTPLPAGSPDEPLCSGASACDGAGACKKAIAQACTTAAECAGNACVGGACCANEVCSSASYVWTRTWGGGDYEFLYGLAPAPDGGFLTMGTYRNGSNYEDIFLARHDAAGTEVWQRRFGGTKSDTPYAAGFLSDGTVVVGGNVPSPTTDLDPGAGTSAVTATSNTGFVSKFDATGTFLWSRVWGTTTHGEVYGVAVGPDDSVVVLGLFQGTIDLDPTAGTDLRSAPPWQNSGFLVKLSKDGDYLWARVTTMEAFGDLAVGKDGSVVYVDGFSGTVDLDPTAGVDNRTATGRQAYMTKLAPDGSYLWSRIFTGSDSKAVDVSVADDGSVAVLGEFSGTVTFDVAGMVSKTSAGDVDVFVTKLGASGAHQWTQVLGGADEEDAASVVFGPGGSVIAVGQYRKPFDSDPGPGVELQPRISTAIGADQFVTAFSSKGVYQWTRIVPSFSFSAKGPAVMLAGAGLLVGSTFDGSNDFDSTAGYDGKTSAGASDAFVTKFLP